MACDIPLCFFDCSYDVDLEWIFDVTVLREIYRTLEQKWAEFAIK
jgi:hypothetical protein